MLLFSGCGYSSIHNQTIGQVKRIIINTPILCEGYVTLDLSLGVMINGTGSISDGDMYFYVPNVGDREKLKEANETGRLVKITYDEKRITFCIEQNIVTSVEVLNKGKKK